MAGYYTEDPLCGWVEERDMALLEKYRVWILDPKETLSSPKPFDLWCLQHNYDNRGEQYGHEAMAVPECRGFECRVRNGWVYVAAQPTTPEEKEADALRDKAYRESLRKIPETKASNDPWGGVRSEPPKAAAPAKPKAKTGSTAN